MPKRVFTDEQRAEVARRYVDGETLVQLAEAFRVSTGPIVDALRRAGVRTRDPRIVATRHECDHSYFDTLDEQRAYWVGFLFADGCVSESKNGTAAPILSLALATIDGDHVRVFRDALRSGHALNIGKAHPNRGFPNVRLSVPSWPLCNALARYGIVPRKSMTAVPPALPPDLERHFWRGVFDGDGCLHVPLKRSPSLSVCGSRATCDAFAAWASALLTSPVGVHPSARIWAATLGGYQRTATVGSEMYRDATVWLPRKRVLYERIAAHAAERAAVHERSAMTLDGVTRTVADWSARTGHTTSALYQRRYNGWTDEQALMTAPGCRPNSA